MDVLTYESYSEARAHFKDLLDAAERGRSALVKRDSSRAAVVNADRLRYFLARMVPSRAEAVSEAGGWSIFIPGVPVAADGSSFDEAIGEMVDALREYAADWQDHLLDAPNHQNNWGLVQLIALSDDQQLKDWLTGTDR
jgi:hypothetical protein